MSNKGLIVRKDNMLHWYFMLIVMGNPVSFGPFYSEERCELASERMFISFEREIQVGKIVKVECWKVTGA